jgi:cyanophycinase
MSVHLVGGGRDLDLAATLYGPFVEEAASRAQRRGADLPRIATVVVADSADLAAGVAWFADALARCRAVEIAALTATEDPADSLRLAGDSAPGDGWWSGVDGLLVGGGLTPAYHRLVQPYAEEICTAVASGLPYAGFSAGAMIASQRALLGGWRLGSVAVTHEDNAEDLDQLSVADGLGLVPATVEVHTAQWGTLSRLVAGVTDGLVARGMAIDEGTVATIGFGGEPGDGLAVRGVGQAWLVERAGRGVRVERIPAG